MNSFLDHIYVFQGGTLTLFTTILGLQFWLTDKHFKDGKVGDKEPL